MYYMRIFPEKYIPNFIQVTHRCSVIMGHEFTKYFIDKKKFINISSSYGFKNYSLLVYRGVN